MPTNLYTNVQVGDNTYTIKRFDAKTGLKMARLVIAKAAPLIPLLDKLTGGNEAPKNPGTEVPKTSGDKTKQNATVVNVNDDQIYSAVGVLLDNLTDKDLDEIIDKCLRVCYVPLPAGLQPVIDETGNYGVEGIEYDMGLTLRLCFEAIKWGASDFFAGNNSLSSLFRKSTGK